VLGTEGRKGWFWYIPLHDNRVSVGVVSDFEYLFNGRGDHETIFQEELDRCPAVKQRVAIGKRASGFYATKDYSYYASQPAGDGWVLIGDAYGFLDPLYSSGVLLALKSGQLAADAIVEALAIGDTSAAQLGKWAPDFGKGMQRMRRLVCEYYDGFSFGRFVKDHPDLKGRLTDLLIGDLFDDKVDALIAPMESMKKNGD
jgi:flavin-dependent dehydrogenase